jgi:undecaprenyl-diphosphatase
MIEFFIQFLADWLMFVIAALAFYAFIFVVPKKAWWKWGVRIFLAGITSYAAAKIIAAVYQPEVQRPFEKLGVEPGAAFLPNPGFPSDHALFAMFLTLAVWYSTKNKYLAGAMLAMTLIVGLARVLALVHTPLDVIGGLVIACIGIVWYRHPLKNIVK